MAPNVVPEPGCGIVPPPCLPEGTYSPLLAVLYNVNDINEKTDKQFMPQEHQAQARPKPGQLEFVWTCSFSLSK